jgi:hypothetical protein
MSQFGPVRLRIEHPPDMQWDALTRRQEPGASAARAQCQLE